MTNQVPFGNCSDYNTKKEIRMIVDLQISFSGKYRVFDQMKISLTTITGS